MKMKLSNFEQDLLNEDREYILGSWFSKEIFDILICDIDKQIEKIKEETLKLENFFLKIKNNNKEYLKEFNQYKNTYNILQHYILYKYRNDYFELIQQFKIPYNRDIQKDINEFTKKYWKINTEKCIEYLHSYGKYEYILNNVGKKLIELWIAQKWELGKRRYMIEEWDEKWTIAFIQEENDIIIEDLPKTPYYKKKIKVPDIIISKFKEKSDDNIF
jgi:hypothetical protein